MTQRSRLSHPDEAHSHMLLGGSYEVGAGGVEVYDGAILANRTNTVVVTINYRLGVLGFLYADGIEGQFGLCYSVL